MEVVNLCFLFFTKYFYPLYVKEVSTCATSTKHIDNLRCTYYVRAVMDMDSLSFISFGSFLDDLFLSTD